MTEPVTPAIPVRADAATVNWHSLKVAVLTRRAKRLFAAAEDARRAAETSFAVARRAGMKSFAIQLPGGRETKGTVAIKAGPVTVDWIDDTLLACVKASTPQHVEEYVDPAALLDPRVIKLLRDNDLGDWIRERVSRKRLAELEEEVISTEGLLLNLDTGAMETVATVHRAPPTGEFAWTPGRGDADLLDQMINAGLITEDGEIAQPPPEVLAA